MEKKKYLMRSLMFVPGHSEKLQLSASKSDADVILLDIEDSVLPVFNKQVARDMVKKNIEAGLFANYDVFVRINDRETGLQLQDVMQLTIPGIEGFLFSKTETAADILYFDRLLEAIERDKGYPVGTFKIIPILETTASIINADAIAKASERNVAIGFGSEDFVSDLEGIRDFEETTSIYVPRAMVAMVARTNKLIAIDAAYIHVHDTDGLVRHLKKGRILGYEGMWVLHPIQNKFANEILSPTFEEVEEAGLIMQLFQEAQDQGKGVAIINGKFIGPPLVVKAKRTLARQELIKSKQK